MRLASWELTAHRAGRAGALRQRPIAWFCALAIAFQCVVIQGHFHLSSLSEPAFDEIGLASPAPVKKDKAPGDDPSGCFICQQMAMAGAAVLPDTPAPAPPAIAEISLPPPAEFLAVDAALSHHWRSRAPPIPA